MVCNHVSFERLPKNPVLDKRVPEKRANVSFRVLLAFTFSIGIAVVPAGSASALLPGDIYAYVHHGQAIPPTFSYGTSLASLQTAGQSVPIGTGFAADGSVIGGDVVIEVFGDFDTAPDSTTIGVYPLREYLGDPNLGFVLSSTNTTGNGTLNTAPGQDLTNGPSVSASYTSINGTLGDEGSARFGIALLEYRDQPLTEAMGVTWDVLVRIDTFDGAIPPLTQLTFTHGGATAFAAAPSFLGFGPPLPRTRLVKSGSTIPVKFRLAVSDPEGSTLAARASVRVSLSGPGISTVFALCTYDVTTHVFQCNMKTPRAVQAGAAYAVTAEVKTSGTGSFVTAPPVNGVQNPETIQFR
jgi:hypothetical protein